MDKNKEIKIINPWLGLVLTIITCGIYGFYWTYQITKSIGIIRGDYENDFWKLLLLSILTCGIYHIYWYYQAAKTIFAAQTRTPNMVPQDRSMMFLAFYIVNICIGLPLMILVPVFVQSDINAFGRLQEKEENVDNQENSASTKVDINLTINDGTAENKEVNETSNDEAVKNKEVNETSNDDQVNSTEENKEDDSTEL